MGCDQGRGTKASVCVCVCVCVCVSVCVSSWACVCVCVDACVFPPHVCLCMQDLHNVFKNTLSETVTDLACSGTSVCGCECVLVCVCVCVRVCVINGMM